MTAAAPLICNVCHQPLGACDQYLVRFDAQHGTTTVVHRSLCFPPARKDAEKPPVQRAAA
jgi:hypothetical protein